MRRRLWITFADFQRAFPRTDRSDLCVILRNNIGLRCGAFALLEDMLRFDVLYIWHSGRSKVTITNGLPEGGSVGPLTYNVLPDTLLRSLIARGFGVGLDVRIPEVWKGHFWNGTGTPCNQLVDMLMASLQGGGYLPSSSLLKAWPALEASAARALDLLASERLVALLHADDPLIVASSMGELQRTLDAIVEWAAAHNAQLHASAKKTVFMYTGPDLELDCRVALHLNGVQGRVDLKFSRLHKWLGVLWPSGLNFDAALDQAISRASGAFATLSGLVNARVIPITLAVDLFESKVDSLLDFGRWLFTLSASACLGVNTAQSSWARALLGAESWRNAAVCERELGWLLSGFARGVRSVALRRARALSLDSLDWYRSSFGTYASLNIGWAAASLLLLEKWGIPDWPDVAEACVDYGSYSARVLSCLSVRCATHWEASASTHGAQVPYLVFQASPSSVLHAVKALSLPWEVLLCVRSWCRLRAGLVYLRSLHGRRSAARHQQCIFCGRGVRNATVHAIGVCPRWCDARSTFVEAAGLEAASPDALCMALLGCTPGSPAFIPALFLADGLDGAATNYWKSKDSDD